jgi:hypothetical protein
MFDVVGYGTSLIVHKALAAGGNPNATGWTDGVFVSLYEYNLLQIPLSERKEEVKDRLKTGEILLAAGARPYISNPVLDEIKKLKLSKGKKQAIQGLRKLAKTVPTLRIAARAAIQTQARKVTGSAVTGQLIKHLAETEHLPLCLKDFIQYDNILQV